jgi:hypothetical protein
MHSQGALAWGIPQQAGQCGDPIRIFSVTARDSPFSLPELRGDPVFPEPFVLCGLLLIKEMGAEPFRRGTLLCFPQCRWCSFPRHTQGLECTGTGIFSKYHAALPDAGFLVKRA